MSNLKIAISLLAALLLATAGAMAERPAPDEAQLNQTWSTLSPREKASVLRLHQALRQMPAEERKFVNDRVERFMQMSPDERRKLKENNDRWQKMPPEEREKMREKFAQRRKEFEEKWRKEHPGQEPPPFPFHHRKSEKQSDKQTSETKPNPQETQQ